MDCIDRQIQYLNEEVRDLESKLEEVERQIGDKANKKRAPVLKERRERLMNDKRLLLAERRALVEKLSGEAGACANVPSGADTALEFFRDVIQPLYGSMFASKPPQHLHPLRAPPSVLRQHSAQHLKAAAGC
ncbi:hypothetical protein VOLCADRAFT_94068 [Volvox carteri f. nagariensis]|uniref:Uncharacterized protein n=1 Tax=Volvox carteri f. nagariensis TaxID=3068 RepID=D8U3U2_VOLCA|nr:uncharacterized protein VOLCADRAFT_94068 [Volvox carteri f. nagariensis]EFJ45587.1 hypothetical protein VOLCADRAFT_94068 [Volvox carteri f. nagariensis]|eukprot:XP_002953277.1 hypothetical protein VOLCADRAFT_94068 [Volvox carteri f. nagariensis]